ncbi:MAG: hypothetical protein L3J35_05390 [Bacteroidales bacterium]|nr:hypothetical protein [Bacteroidales bacterium]
MKKITYFLLFLLAISSCKYDENPYSFTREFDGGTFITPDGKVKYISGSKDSLILVTDVYAEVRENITYVKKNSDGVLADSILIYGHVYSLDPIPVVCGYDSVDKIDLLARLDQNSVIYPTSEPTEFMTEDDLYAGFEFTNSFGLKFEKDYYVRSFVVTGYFDGSGSPVYKDIAYNQNILKVTTAEPNNLWIGGGPDYFEETPAEFPDQLNWGSTSFSYNGYMFVLAGHDEIFGDQIVVERYDPVTNTWSDPPPYKSLNIGSLSTFTNAVCFVIEDVETGVGVYHDCLFLGLGITSDANQGNTEFYRLDLEANSNNPIGSWGEWDNITNAASEQDFPGIITENSIAFTINGIAYLGLGTYDFNNEVVQWLYKYDPNEKGENRDKGTWTKINDFPGGTRTEAVTFTIGNNVYVFGGRDNSGVYYNDLWMARQSSGDNLTWVQRRSLPAEARVEAIGFALGETGYVGLGKNEAGVALSDFWRYNPFTNQWDQRANFGEVDIDPDPNDDVHDWIVVGLPRFEAVGVGIKISDSDYRGYVGTGWAGIAGDAHLFSDFWQYRP